MNNRYPSKKMNVLIHILVWTGLFTMPHVVAYFTRMETPPLDAGMFVMPLQIMLLFYLNYLWLINKFLFRKRIGMFLVINLLLIAGMTVGMFYLRQIFISPEYVEIRRPHGGGKPFMDLPAAIGGLVQVLVVGLSVAIKMTGKWYEARQQVQELEQANMSAELQQLKSQLNPHFLFNSLNNIYALIAFNPDKAQLSLHNLCDMLRYQLYEANKETIPLEKEVEFVRSYCELMRLRLPTHVAVEVDLPDQPQPLYVAPLLFVSIVENAFKHGVSQSEASRIFIGITGTPERVDCLVKNSYYPKTDNDRSGSGIGLENLRRRLELLYPERYTFTAEKIGEEFVAHLVIKTAFKIDFGQDGNK